MKVTTYRLVIVEKLVYGGPLSMSCSDYHRVRWRTIDATVSRSSTRFVRTPSYSVVVGTGHRWWSQSPMRLPQYSCRLSEITINFLGFPRLQGEIWPKPVWPLDFLSRERGDS
jgi:hypothetical protein